MGFSAKGWKRFGTEHKILRGLINSPAPDAENFRSALDAALAGGFPIDFIDKYGKTLLYWALSSLQAVRAGLPQVLIEADADVDAKDSYGRTPLSIACWDYITDAAPEYLQVVDALLAAGARPELDESWKEYSPDAAWRQPEQRARCGLLEAYIASWPERRTAGRAQDAAPGFDYAL